MAEEGIWSHFSVETSKIFSIFAGYYAGARKVPSKRKIKITRYDIKRDQKSLP